MAERKRLDVLLVERGLAPSREKAKAFVMAGVVYADGQKASKAGELYSEDVALDVRAASEYRTAATGTRAFNLRRKILNRSPRA